MGLVISGLDHGKKGAGTSCVEWISSRQHCEEDHTQAPHVRSTPAVLSFLQHLRADIGRAAIAFLDCVTVSCQVVVGVLQ